MQKKILNKFFLIAFVVLSLNSCIVRETKSEQKRTVNPYQGAPSPWSQQYQQWPQQQYAPTQQQYQQWPQQFPQPQYPQQYQQQPQYQQAPQYQQQVPQQQYVPYQDNDELYLPRYFYQ